MIRHFLRLLLLLVPFVILSRVQAELPANSASTPRKPEYIPPLLGDPEAPRKMPRAAVSDTLKKSSASPSPAPAKGDSGRSYDVFVARSERGAAAGTLVGIGFFNHSDRDILLKINDRTVKLASKYYMQIKLPREFNWRELEGNEQKIKVPADADGVEIVFKR